MGQYIVRRIMIAFPTLLLISLVVFGILELSPADPVGNLPLTIPPEVREQIRESMGVNDPFFVKYLKWLRQFMVNEPLNILEEMTGITVGDSESRLRYISWQTRSPIIDLVVERLPQTLWVVGLSYVLAIVVAVPVGVIQAYKQYSIFDQVVTFFATIGFSVPTFFTGLLFIIVFSVQLKWFPSIYDTTHVVTDFPSFIVQMRQTVMPVIVLALFFMALISRHTRSSMLDNLKLDYVRTARSKGISEADGGWAARAPQQSHPGGDSDCAGHSRESFRARSSPSRYFRVNGLGQLLIIAIQGGDLPTVQTLTFIFAVMIVFFNIVADLLYAVLDPRIRYD